MATVDDLKNRLNSISPGKFGVRQITPKDRAKYTAETIVSQGRPFASAHTLITISDYPDDFALSDIDDAIAALATALDIETSAAALTLVSARLDLRRQNPGQGGGPGQTANKPDNL